MTQTSYPFEGIDTTETQFSKWAKHFNNGVNDEPTGTALEVTVGSGLAVDVEAGEAMVRGHYYISDATESLSLATADATNDRLDLVVLKLDPVANSITLVVKTGTPAGSPSAPSPTQTEAGVFEQPLAEVLVPATSGVPTTITDRREFMGTRLGSWSTAGRPTPAGRVLFGFNTDTETVEFYNVNTSAWQDVTPSSIDDIGDVTITSVSDGDLLAYDSGTSEWINQALESAQLPTGSVLQIVRATDSTDRTTTSNSFTDASISVTITPNNASNNLIVFWNGFARADDDGGTVAVGLLQISDSSNVGLSGAETVEFGIQNTNGGSVFRGYGGFNLIGYVNAGSTSALTFKGRFAKASAAQSVTVRNSSSTGQMIVMEVAA